MWLQKRLWIDVVQGYVGFVIYISAQRYFQVIREVFEESIDTMSI